MIHANNKSKLLYVIIITIIGVYIGFQYILPLFIPFIVAYFIAWCLLPIVRFLNQKLKIPKIIGGIISLGLLGTGVVWLLLYLSGLLIDQVTMLLKNLPIYFTMITSRVDTFCNFCDKFFGMDVGTTKGLFDSNIESVLNTVKNKIMPIITTQSLSIAIGFIGVIGILLIVIVSILLLIKDEEEYGKSFRSTVFYPDIHLVTSKLSETGIAYLRTQAIMMIFISTLCSVGLIIIKNKYALLIGIGIGVFDAFPVLGSGLILVPWGIISIINQDIYSAAILFTMYLGCLIIRQFLEPRLLGNRIGVKPVYTLVSMYVGVQLFGFPGFFLGPLGLVIIITIVKETEKRLQIRKVCEE